MNRAAGLDDYHAVIEATVQRTRPVILTALAAVLAFVPSRISFSGDRWAMVDTLAELEEVLPLGVDAVLLDNMPVAILRQAVTLIDGRLISEASGGITIANAAAVAATGIDLISLGSLTHSAPVLDIGLDCVL